MRKITKINFRLVHVLTNTHISSHHPHTYVNTLKGLDRWLRG